MLHAQLYFLFVFDFPEMVAPYLKCIFVWGSIKLLFLFLFIIIMIIVLDDSDHHTRSRGITREIEYSSITQDNLGTLHHINLVHFICPRLQQKRLNLYVSIVIVNIGCDVRDCYPS